MDIYPLLESPTLMQNWCSCLFLTQSLLLQHRTGTGRQNSTLLLCGECPCLAWHVPPGGKLADTLKPLPDDSGLKYLWNPLSPSSVNGTEKHSHGLDRLWRSPQSSSHSAKFLWLPFPEAEGSSGTMMAQVFPWPCPWHGWSRQTVNPVTFFTCLKGSPCKEGS